MGPRHMGRERSVSENGGSMAYERWGYMGPCYRGAQGPFRKTGGADGVRVMGIYGPPARGARDVRFGKRGVDGVRAMGIYGFPGKRGALAACRYMEIFDYTNSYIVCLVVNPRKMPLILGRSAE